MANMKNPELELINRNRRTCLTATITGLDNQYGYDYTSENGMGWAVSLESLFLHAACVWADNPSCKVYGKLANTFFSYCAATSWAKHLVSLRQSLQECNE